MKKALQWALALQQAHWKEGGLVAERVESGWFTGAVLNVLAAWLKVIAYTTQRAEKACKPLYTWQQAPQEQGGLATEGVEGGKSMVGVLDV